MISFTTRARRNDEVNAWDVLVEAWFDPAEEVTSDPVVEEALSQEWVEEDGILIGRLEGLMTHLWPVNTRDGLIEILELNDGDGNTWDVAEEVRAAAVALTRWVRSDAGADLLLEGAEPVQTLILGRELHADPFVDRGALLGMMLQHLTAFSPNRILFAHQEPEELTLPEDQAGRVKERVRAFRSVAARVGYEAHALLPEQPRASEWGPLANLILPRAGRPLLVGSILPDGPDYPEWTIWDDLEGELIEVSDWALRRLGVELTLFEGELPDEEHVAPIALSGHPVSARSRAKGGEGPLPA